MVTAQVMAALAPTVAAALLAHDTSSSPRLFTQRGTATAVVDTGAIVVRLANGTSERVQLIGLAALAAGSCGYAHARADVKMLVVGKPVWLAVVKVESRRAGQRTVLAYAIMPGGLDVGLELIKRGDATVQAGQHPFKLFTTYTRAQTTAETNSIGLWACSNSPAPATSAPTRPVKPQAGPSKPHDPPSGAASDNPHHR
jgi:endonuclease YncB( thermonuclease family)